MNHDRPFRLFASCLPVRGARRSVLCDVQRKTYHVIPNELHELLHNCQGQSIAQVKERYPDTPAAAIDEYFAFLLAHEYIFFTDQPDAFPPLDLRWERPEPITNALIDGGAYLTADLFARLMAQLDELNCPHLQLRFFEPVELSYVQALLDRLEGSCLRSVELLLPGRPEWPPEHLLRLLKGCPRLTTLVVHSHAENRMVKTGASSVERTILFVTNSIDSAAHCGVISPDYFSINLPTFTESQAFNTCLNRKIAIDREGRIRNCPSLPESYGRAGDTPLAAALEQPGFKKYWTIHKDQIAVCRDCEFRHICTDCRAYRDNPDDVYSKPLKCGYDPYTGQWEEWSSHPLKREARAYYGFAAGGDGVV